MTEMMIRGIDLSQCLASFKAHTNNRELAFLDSGRMDD